MRYEDEMRKRFNAKPTKYNSGYESAGFESFNRDDCMCFMESEQPSVNYVTASCDSWSPQGTSTSAYYNDAAIAALNCCTSSVATSANEISRALHAVSGRLREASHWSDRLNLKNRFSRGNRDLRSQLLTI